MNTKYGKTTNQTERKARPNRWDINNPWICIRQVHLVSLVNIWYGTQGYARAMPQNASWAMPQDAAWAMPHSQCRMGDTVPHAHDANIRGAKTETLSDHSSI